MGESNNVNPFRMNMLNNCSSFGDLNYVVGLTDPMTVTALFVNS